jgi:hypothetical protein
LNEALAYHRNKVESLTGRTIEHFSESSSENESLDVADVLTDSDATYELIIVPEGDEEEV